MPDQPDLDRLVDEAQKRSDIALESWNSFVRELQVPSELMPALMTARPQLIKLVKPRAMSEEEVKQLLEIIGTLMETNWVLQEHSRTVAHLVKEWVGAFRGLNTVGWRIRNFANFVRSDQAQPEDI